MTEKKMKEWIDNASYEELLHRWRFASIGSLWFQGEMGQYYSKAMKEKRTALEDAEAVRASKFVGW